MKHLIVGLGNIGAEYANTRHNIGFKILDAFAEASNIFFSEDRYGSIAECRVKNQQLLLLKPSTYMNLSGNAVRYWMQKEKIDMQHLLVLVDDLSLPFGTLRLRARGSAGGHNGLKNIQDLLSSDAYARLRFGIGNEFSRGAQVEYVLGEWSSEETKLMGERLDIACDIIKSFCLQGVERTMNAYNKKEHTAWLRSVFM